MVVWTKFVEVFFFVFIENVERFFSAEWSVLDLTVRSEKLKLGRKIFYPPVNLGSFSSLNKSIRSWKFFLLQIRRSHHFTRHFGSWRSTTKTHWRQSSRIFLLKINWSIEDDWFSRKKRRRRSRRSIRFLSFPSTNQQRIKTNRQRSPCSSFSFNCKVLMMMMMMTEFTFSMHYDLSLFCNFPQRKELMRKCLLFLRTVLNSIVIVERLKVSTKVDRPISSRIEKISSITVKHEPATTVRRRHWHDQLERLRISTDSSVDVLTSRLKALSSEEQSSSSSSPLPSCSSSSSGKSILESNAWKNKHWCQWRCTCSIDGGDVN